ncbi:hypothetical protein C1645_840124 [Glomus cerebriforme]|uniref:Uncharacterized protein n=1 Tax=Glomus cerebriforme TaxID=658196 RepID=A0A397SBH3_9GLOM|nr:hypothetical protein C1645_840124 [Glomus cerebriforme]
MLTKAIEENIGAVENLDYKTKMTNIDVEADIEVQIPDRKFREIWSFACNGYRVEMQQMNADQKETFRKRRRYTAKIINLPPNTIDQQLEGELLPHHMKYWKVYKVNDECIEALVLFQSEKDKKMATIKKVRINQKEYEW